MIRNIFTWRAVAVWAALLLVPGFAIAQSPYEGIYFGSYQGPLDNGEFALIVDDRGRGTLAAYDSADDEGYIENGIRLRTDGSFQFVTLRGVRIEGQATAGGISGNYVTAGTEGSFTGWLAAVDGPLRDAAGYYSGPVSITDSSPDNDIVIDSRMVAIIAADGTAFFLLDRFFPGFTDNWQGSPGFDLDLDLDLNLDLDLDFGLDFGFGLNFDASFPFGSGFDSPFPFGSGSSPRFPFGPALDAPFPFGSGFNSGFPFGSTYSSGFPFGSAFNSGFPFGSGSNLPFPFGSRLNAPFHAGWGNCGSYQQGSGLNWPFNFGLDYSFRISFLGAMDLEFNFNLPTCQAAWPWHQFPEFINDSGGIVLIEADGNIQGWLTDGLALQGRLDIATLSADGILFQQQGTTSWTGHWEIERDENAGSPQAATMYNLLSDINGDGRADITWHHAVTGQNAAWLMDGTEIMAELPLEIQWDSQWDTHWTLVTAHKLNDDLQPDLVWRHSISGEMFVWLSGDAVPVQFELDPAWQVVGSGDFDADFRPEILVRHSATGANAVIADLPGQAVLTPLPSIEDQAWSPVAVADFNGDARADVLWMNRHAPDLRIWLMNGLTPERELTLVVTDTGQGEFTGIGDFDGDGSTDILWRDHVTGIASFTLGPAGNVPVDIQLDTNMAPVWHLAAIGDLDGDGTDDLVWRHSLTGDNTAWRIVDAQVVETASLNPVEDPNWMIRP
jgi:hypothetical protein